MPESKFFNHGMGLTTQREHDEMVAIGAIVCKNGVDFIRCEYPKVIVMKDGSETTIDVNGSMAAAIGESETLKRQGRSARVGFFPRAYTDWVAKEKSRRAAEDYQREAVATISEVVTKKK